MAAPGASEPVPYDLEAEKCVLGSMLRDPQCAVEVMSGLVEPDFYLPRHRRLFQLMTELEQRSSGSCDVITVAHEMERHQCSEEVGGRSYLEELMSTVPSLAFLENHIRIVRDSSLRRGLLRAAETITQEALQSTEEVTNLLDRAEQSVFEVGDRLVQGQVASAKDLVPEVLDRVTQEGGGPQGLNTGFIDLDERQGFRPGDMVVLAARPSMGKTALALNLMERVALKTQKAVLLFSLEMPADQIIQRMLSSHGRVRHDALRRGRLSATDRQRLGLSAGELSNGRIFVDDSSQPSLAEIRAKARRLRRENNLDLVVIDYLQLLGAKAESRQQEIAVISRTLKAMARELSIPVLALAQLNRAAEQRDSHRPRLSDLRECVVGETKVLLADGHQVPIASLVHQRPQVMAIFADGNLRSAASDCVWPVGERFVYRLRLAGGREICATKDHRLLGRNGWSRIGDLRVGDDLACIPTQESERNLAAGAEFHSARHCDRSVDGMETGRNLPTKPVPTSTRSYQWQSIEEMSACGRRMVYDLSVPGPANWIANGIVSHNSGAIEQDADMVMLLFREEYYTPTEDNAGLAELIVAKNRNGATGTVLLRFTQEVMRFENAVREPVF